MSRKAQVQGSRRVHHCERCGWSTRREAHASHLPCKRCGGRVLLTKGRRTPEERQQVKLMIPRWWWQRLGPKPLREVRLAIAARIGVEYTPPGAVDSAAEARHDPTDGTRSLHDPA